MQCNNNISERSRCSTGVNIPDIALFIGLYLLDICTFERMCLPHTHKAFLKYFLNKNARLSQFQFPCSCIYGFICSGKFHYCHCAYTASGSALNYSGHLNEFVRQKREKNERERGREIICKGILFFYMLADVLCAGGARIVFEIGTTTHHQMFRYFYYTNAVPFNRSI